MRDTNLVNALREHAERAQTNEWETLITLGDDLTEAADRIEAQAKEIENLRGQLPRWIPVEERLPENGVPVLINYIASDDGKYHPDGTAVWTDYGCFWWEGSLEDCDAEVAVPITHWMPLPEPPEEIDMDHEAAETLRQLCRNCDLDRLEKLAEADRDGRVVVRPCKVGDTVYEVTSRKTISEYRVKAIRVELFCTFIEWDIVAGFVDKSIFGVPVDEIGKTVFLTREEAEAALEAMKDG